MTEQDENTGPNCFTIAIKVDGRTKGDIELASRNNELSRSAYIRGILKVNHSQTLEQTPITILNKIKLQLQTLENMIKTQVKP